MRSKVRTNTVPWALALGIASLVAATGGCGGGCTGCAGMEPVPGGFPVGARIENGGQLRVSSSGLDFIRANVGPLVAGMMPDGLVFDVPPMCDMNAGITIDICGTGDANNCTPDAPTCAIEAEIQEVIITPQDPPGNVLDIEVRLNVHNLPGQQIRTHGAATNCNIDIDTTDGGQAYVRMTTVATLTIDPMSKRLGIQVDPLTIPDGDIEDADIDISGVNFWDVSCGIIELFAEGLIVDQITSQVSGMADPLIQDNLCMKCDQGEACPSMSTCDGQVCQEDGGSGCVMPLGMEGRLDLGGMLSSIAPGKQANLDLYLWAGGYGTTNANGISIGMLTGAVTQEHNECVPQRDPPDFSPAPLSTAFQGNARPTDQEPFHVGIGLHKKFLDAAGYAVYDSGTLCLDLGPREVPQLTTGTFQLLAASILDLTHDEEAPIVISVRPQNPVYFTLSEPVVTQDPGTGEYTIETPLLTVRSTDFAIDFYVFMDYRFVRAFRILADLAIPIALVVNAQNQLVPVLGDLADGFENLRVTESTLLEEEPATMATLFPTILGLAAGFLGDLGAIDLPDLQGFQLVLDDGSITAVDNNTLMAIYANLALAPPSPKGGHLAVRTSAEITARHLPPAGSHLGTLAEYRERGPAVTLALGGEAPDDSAAPLEWQYRVNGGFWSLFTDAPVVLLRRPEFLLQGRHRIEVRGRVKGQPRTLDLQPQTLEFLVDTGAPKLTLERVGDALVWEGRDNLTAADALEYSVSLAGGPWSAWRAGKTRHALPQGFQGTLRVRARDEAGNETVVSDQVLGLYGRVTVPPSNSGCGCTQPGTGAGDGLLWLGFGLLALGWIRRRRDGRVKGRARGRSLPFLGALILTAAGGAHCDCGGKPHGDQCADAGVDFQCSNLELVCYPGQELQPAEPLTIDPQTCLPLPVVCECTGQADQVDPGDFGRFLSIDARDGVVVVSSYSDRYDDLVVSTVDGTSVVPEAVDGVPSNSPSRDPEGYRGGVTQRGDDVGTFTSVKIDAAGTVHVSYVDMENGALRYARGTPGAWDVHEVQAYPNEEAHTYYTALQLGAGDAPAIAYMVTGLPDPARPGGWMSQVRYAVASDDAPASDADWSVGVADESPIPCTGLCASGEVCVADTWLCVAEDGACGTCADGEGCVAGACVAVLEEPPFMDHPEGIGLFVTAGRLSTGAPVLAYHDRSFGLLRVAVGSDTGDASPWTATLVEGDELTDIGLYTSLVVDASDVLHLSYTDAVRDELLYSQVDAAGTVLLREVVDPGTRPLGGLTEEHHVVGLDSKVFIDGEGALQVLYQDGTTADLWIARRNGVDDWTLTPLLTGDPGYGFFVDVATDTDGTLWAAQYVYDRAGQGLTYLDVWQL